MSSEGQFFRNRKYANLFARSSFGRAFTRQNESRFRKIHRPRQRLHLAVAQPARVGKDRERITRQRRSREDIELNKFICSLPHSSTCAWEPGKTNINFRWHIDQVLMLSLPSGNCRTMFCPLRADVAQLVEQRFRKPQVTGSNPVVGSSLRNDQLVRIRPFRLDYYSYFERRGKYRAASCANHCVRGSVSGNLVC